ncbi:hypothetical protein ACLOJK_026526 [Asimina triloba]
MEKNTHLLFSLVILSFLIFHALFNDVSAADPAPILVSCGSEEKESTDVDGRKWVGDADPKQFKAPGDSIVQQAQTQDPSLPSVVPYMTARIFTKPSTYVFPVASGQRHWLRLHFYPSNYGDMNTTDAFLDVVANGVTLLRNFSAAITAHALTQAYIVREYSLVPTSANLNITFAPSDTHNNSYAFVNGIEVIKTPDIFQAPATLVESGGRKIEYQTYTIQTMYRLNVGGQFIAATNDSAGLTREWYDDTPYVSGSGDGIVLPASKFDTKIKFSNKSYEQIAPEEVYSTARTMGPNPNVTRNFNLSWTFHVDPKFLYAVRMHFCELQLKKPNQRVFDIYINHQLAEQYADVIVWAGAIGVPVYRDYAKFIVDGNGSNGDGSVDGDAKLVVDIHPNIDMQPEYVDAILNGLEIFKLNDTVGNLAGPNPVPSAMLLAADEELIKGDGGESLWDKDLIGKAAGGAAGFGLVFAICVAAYHRKKRVADDNHGISGWLPLYSGSTSKSSTLSGKSCASSHLSSLAVSLCRHFSLAEIKAGTKNFEEALVIGVGGFGKVYKGVIDGGTKVAIKRANPSSEQGVHEFQTEIEMLSKLRHRHLVSLIGYCEESNEMILVYDYMGRGTLREHLYKTKEQPLSWKQRLEICIGAARGLHYLHTGAKYTIIHRDVKTTNILVDDSWVAKVSDFGLSKTGPSLDQTHVSTVVKGSFGYLDPEYFRRQQLTEKSDVYSFGVVLFEVLLARPALNPSLPKEQVSLADWALACQRKGTLADVIDPHLKGKINPLCLNKFAETAEKCLADQGADRPSMGDVLWNLEFSLQLHDNPDSVRQSDSPSGRNSSDAAAAASFDSSSNNNNNNNTIFGAGTEVSDESDLNSGAVFSQLIHPKGR